MTKTCQVCAVEYGPKPKADRPHLLDMRNFRRSKFCSHSCSARSREGSTLTPEHRANIAAALTGIPKSPEYRARVSGESSPHWKGDEVGYFGIHSWLKKALGPARQHLCLACLDRADEWANINGKEYRRDPEQFAPMCLPCHRSFDLDKAA